MFLRLDPGEVFIAFSMLLLGVSWGGVVAFAPHFSAASGPGLNFSTFGVTTHQWWPISGTLELAITEHGIGLDDFVVAVGIPANSQGETFSLEMVASAFARTSRPVSGTTMATADFGSTLNWLGLVSATLPDGTPYDGPLEIISDSGFNYLESAVVVPLPAAAPAFALALVPLAIARRRRT